MQPFVDPIHEFFVGVEALGSQPDLYLGEDMFIAWRNTNSGTKFRSLNAVNILRVKNPALIESVLIQLFTNL
jgi:hypothetical protein